MTDTLEKHVAMLQPTWEHADRFVWVWNEMDVYAQMGLDGWELVGYGLVSRFRRPAEAADRRVWTYRRVIGYMTMTKHLELEKDWTLIGGWMGVYHYFKKPV